MVIIDDNLKIKFSIGNYKLDLENLQVLPYKYLNSKLFNITHTTSTKLWPPISTKCVDLNNLLELMEKYQGVSRMFVQS